MVGFLKGRALAAAAIMATSSAAVWKPGCFLEVGAAWAAQGEAVAGAGKACEMGEEAEKGGASAGKEGGATGGFGATTTGGGPAGGRSTVPPNALTSEA